MAVAGADLYNCFTGGAQPFSIAFWVYNGDGNASSGDAYRAVFFGDYGLTGAKNINLEKTAAGLVRFYWTADTAVGAMSNTTLTASA